MSGLRRGEKHFVSLFGRLDDCQSLGRVRYGQV